MSGEGGLTDQEISDRIASQLNASYVYLDLVLVAIMDISWQRLTPGVDSMPHGMEPDDDVSQIYFQETCLSYAPDNPLELFMITGGWLYGEEQLRDSETGARPAPWAYQDIGKASLELSDVLPPRVESALLEHYKESPGHVESWLSTLDDPELVFKAIPSMKIRSALERLLDKLS